MLLKFLVGFITTFVCKNKSKEAGIFYTKLAGKLLFLLSDSLVFLVIVHVKFLDGIERINKHFTSKVTFQLYC